MHLSEMLDLSYETAISGLMSQRHCDRTEAVQALAHSYQIKDQEKLESLRRAARHISRAG